MSITFYVCLSMFQSGKCLLNLSYNLQTIFSAVLNLLLDLIIEFLISNIVPLFLEFIFFVKYAVSYFDFLFYRYFQDFLFIYLNKIEVIIYYLGSL